MEINFWQDMYMEIRFLANHVYGDHMYTEIKRPANIVLYMQTRFLVSHAHGDQFLASHEYADQFLASHVYGDQFLARHVYGDKISIKPYIYIYRYMEIRCILRSNF